MRYLTSSYIWICVIAIGVAGLVFTNWRQHTERDKPVKGYGVHQYASTPASEDSALDRLYPNETIVVGVVGPWKKGNIGLLTAKNAMHDTGDTVPNFRQELPEGDAMFVRFLDSGEASGNATAVVVQKFIVTTGSNVIVNNVFEDVRRKEAR